MSLDSIIDLTITVQDTAVTRAGFGLPLVMDYHTNWPERYRLYSSTTAMVADGFAADDPAVVLVGKILGQNPLSASINHRPSGAALNLFFTRNVVTIIGKTIFVLLVSSSP